LKPTIVATTPIVRVEHSETISSADRDAFTEISDGCVTISAPLNGAICRDPK